MSLIGWNIAIPPPPPLVLINVPDDQLTSTTILDFPCHSERVERAIKDVISVSGKVYTHHRRHGMLISMQKSRKPNPEKKKTFHNLVLYVTIKNYI